MNKTLHRPTLIVVIAIVGVLLAMAFNTTQISSTVSTERASDLVDVVHDMESQRDTLQERLAILREQMDTLENAAAEDSGVREAYTRELDLARQGAGLSGVAGPGVEIVLGDGADVAPGSDPNDYLIHDADITSVVNALFSGGAEAVDVNGERIVATTPIRCAGTTILVNATRLGSPYVIRAIGDPEVLEEAVMEDPSASLLLTQYRNQFGLQVLIDHFLEIEVEPYRGSFRPEYAQTPQEG